jgi:hypothetical protein
MKAHGELKIARDRLVALCRAMKEQEGGWAEVKMEPKRGESATAEVRGEEPTTAPVIDDVPSCEASSATPVFLVQALGLTFLPCSIEKEAADEKTYRQLLQAEAEAGKGEGTDVRGLEMLLEVQGQWM